MTGAQNPFASPNPHRLWRDPAQGRIFGVCAGLADYFGISAFPLRVVVVLAALFGFFLPVVAAYLLLAVVLKPRPPEAYRSEEEEAFWRSVSIRPDRSVAGLGQKFHDLERRLADMETCVTSREFQLARDIGELERRPPR
ncbi:envelope stress response membrane protein PspC [Arenibaculum pallidiluteum]|uniref:envelope stress response membrane protein PspC n=1 Tax=Arenibaculum pallidiluteum TaxID=2812559 RepID=UPI001A95B227|nr:envelope stress response membrane protein PspC [Arenibaculum pallidiluteum]